MFFKDTEFFLSFPECSQCSTSSTFSSKLSSCQWFNLFNLPVHSSGYTPVAFARMVSGKIPLDLSLMFKQIEPEFIRSMCKAIFLWDGLKAEVMLSRIHGEKYSLMPIQKN